MDIQTTNRLRKVMTNAKTGGRVSDDDQDFLQKCWQSHRTEYVALKKEVDDDCIRQVNPFAK
jgi:hypothetical protein